MKLTLCGAARLETDDPAVAEVRLPAKSLALLAYLAIKPGKHTRDTLCALLWGESPDDKAHTSLRQALSQLRMALGERLGLDRGTVELAADVSSDVAEFLRWADGGDERATDIDIPQLLTGLTLRDAQPFEEWKERTRHSLLVLYRSALTAAARAAHARHDWRRSVLLGTRWHQLDQLSDDAAQFLVEAHYLKGDREAALATYRRYRTVLLQETGHAPGLKLREFAARVEHESSHPAPVRLRAVPDHPLPSFDAALVGREKEWATLEQAWRATEDGTAHLVLIDGESGVGKSRLLDDFLRLLSANGTTVLRSRAFEAGLTVPFSATLDILRGAIDAPGIAGTDSAWLAQIARVVPEFKRAFPGLPDATSVNSSGATMLQEGVAQLLLATCEESPLAIVIDDVHWSDAESCSLVHFLVRRLSDAPILWCMATTLGVGERDAPASRLVRALRATEGTVRLALAPLSVDDVRRMIRELGRVRQPDGATRLSTRIHEVTGGNPLYVNELLKSLFARGWLAVDGTTHEWITTPAAPGELSSGALPARELFPHVREAMAERIAALPDEEHALLLTIAATGRGCHTSLLSYVHGISRLRAAHICDALVERHLVNESDGTYHCTHEVLTDVVRDSMGTSRRREVHRMIALALTDAAASMHQVADPGEVARHAEAGGEAAMAHRFALIASSACAARSAWNDALTWLDVASANARTPDEVQAADVATAHLMERAGAIEPISNGNGVASLVSVIGRGDMDIAAYEPIVR